jgi:hypothetical protein
VNALPDPKRARTTVADQYPTGRVRDDFALGSGRFDREFTDVVAIQDEISRGIVNSLRLKLGGGRRRYETSPEAYELYPRGASYFIRARQSGAGDSHLFVNFAGDQDLSIEFAEQFKVLGACESDQWR